MKKILVGLLAVFCVGRSEGYVVRVVNKTGRNAFIDVHFATLLCHDDKGYHLEPENQERIAQGLPKPQSEKDKTEYYSKDSPCDLTSMGGYVEYPVPLTPQELIQYGIDAASYAAGTAIVPPHALKTRKIGIINMPDRQSAKSTQWVLVQLAKKTANDPDPKFGFVQVNNQKDIDSY